jgi:hypothetical protein
MSEPETVFELHEQEIDSLLIRITQLETENKRLRVALSEFLEMYVAMVNSGDCGNWNAEEDPEVVKAREALSGGGST